MNDRPTIAELLDAVEHFLESEAVPGLEGPARFHARVAANVVRIVARELAFEAQHLVREWDSLARVLEADASRPADGDLDALRELLRARNEELVRRIRTGQADTGPWRDAVLAHLSDVIGDKLTVSLGSGPASGRTSAAPVAAGPAAPKGESA